MKIGIEAQRIFRASKHGMDVVAIELITRIQKMDARNEYYVFAADGPDRRCIAPSANFHTEILHGLTYADREQLALPRAIRKYRPDILHCTANTAPLNCRAPLILTLHDIIYLEPSALKGSAYQNFGNLYRRYIVPPAIRKARTIITVSEFERQVITKRFPDVAEKIMVIANGVNERFRRVQKEEADAFRTRHGLPESFILFLGNTARKKNTAGVVQAYVLYHAMVPDPLPIVITDYDRNNVLRMLQAVNKTEIIGSFIFPGYVSVMQMHLLYNCSTLFLYPSLRESFGLPILEAMACGVPVITSATSSMPEVAGDAAVLADPTDANSIAMSIRAMLEDVDARQSYIKKGLARASQFSWDDAAKKLIQEYLK